MSLHACSTHSQSETSLNDEVRLPLASLALPARGWRGLLGSALLFFELPQLFRMCLDEPLEVEQRHHITAQVSVQHAHALRRQRMRDAEVREVPVDGLGHGPARVDRALQLRAA